MQMTESNKEYEVALPIHGVKTEFSPMIAESASNVIATEGGEAKFQVRLASIPEPEVAWYKNGKLIGPKGGQLNSKYRFYYESRAHSHTRGLVISPVTAEDLGNYELKAWNKLGQVACQASLKIKGKSNLSKSFKAGVDKQVRVWLYSF